MGIYIGAVTMENSMEISLKIKNRTTIRCKYVTSGYLCEEYENTTKIYASPMFITALFTIVKICRHPQCKSTGEWIKKMSHTHTHTHIYIYVYIYIYIYMQWITAQP